MTSMPGRPPTPAALRVLKGDRAARVALENEPQPEPSDVPKPPGWLPVDAKRVWRRLAPELHAQAVLTTWDTDALAVYCTAVIHHREACLRVAEEGVMVGAVKNPALQVARDCSSIIRAFATEFGLTPIARARFGQVAEQNHRANRAAADKADAAALLA